MSLKNKVYMMLWYDLGREPNPSEVELVYFHIMESEELKDLILKIINEKVSK